MKMRQGIGIKLSGLLIGAGIIFWSWTQQNKDHVINHKGNWLGSCLDKVWMNKEKLTSGIWTCHLRIDVPALYQLS